LAVSPTRTAASRKGGRKAPSRAKPKASRRAPGGRTVKKKAVRKAAKKPVRKKAVRAARKAAARKTTRKAVRKPATKKTVRKAARKPAAKKTARKAARKPAAKKTARKTAKPAAAPALPGQPSAEALARSRQEAEDYQKALAAYAHCLELLQNRHWEAASRALAEFTSHHGRERELAQRARTYLRVCAQHLDSKSMQPKDFDGRCYLAVVLANKGEYKEALATLAQALEERPNSDKVFYLMASTKALKGDRRGALDALEKAIALDERNRIWAANNPDFAGLRDDEEFITLTTREDEEY
jgi:tetratricopeptide (TPR) repeat protein